MSFPSIDRYPARNCRIQRTFPGSCAILGMSSNNWCQKKANSERHRQNRFGFQGCDYPVLAHLLKLQKRLSRMETEFIGSHGLTLTENTHYAL